MSLPPWRAQGGRGPQRYARLQMTPAATAHGKNDKPVGGVRAFENRGTQGALVLGPVVRIARSTTVPELPGAPRESRISDE
jgi:hypothetical protein